MKFVTKSKKIGDHVYEVQQLDAVSGRKALFRLTKAVGPAFASEDFSKLFASLTEDDLDYFYDLFACRTTIKGGKYGDGAPQLDNAEMALTHFADNYFEMCEWLAFCGEVNFKSFFTQAFAKWVELNEKAQAKLKAPAKPPTADVSTK